MAAILLRLGSGLLFVAALALFALAFTRFDGAAAPPPGSPDASGYEGRMLRDAQVSIAYGLAGCVVLVGAFACHQRGGRGPSSPATPRASAEDPPRPGS